LAGWHGLREYRVHNKDEEVARKHFRKVANVLDDFFRAMIKHTGKDRAARSQHYAWRE
jgi:hypothetical protein